MNPVRGKAPGPRRVPRALAALFLAPALLLLGALVVGPVFATVARSFYSATGESFVGLENYREMFTSPSTLTAIRNNVLWVVFAPSLVTALGLVFAVLAEKVRWSAAFKAALFLPMAISFLSAGVIWRLVYDQDPRLGLANAALRGAVGLVRPPGPYPGARPSRPELWESWEPGRPRILRRSLAPGETAALGLVAVPPGEIPSPAKDAKSAPPEPGVLSGTVWFDFSRGGGGRPGRIDPTERGLPGIRVEAVRSGEVAGWAVTGSDGTFAIRGLAGGSYRLRIPDADFRAPFGGVPFLGPALVTPALIVAYVWIWAGFAMVLIGAGLAAIPREVLEAARVDGAGEWQLLRRVTVPLLGPVLAVVWVTLVLNVLKIFDLVLVAAPGSVQDDANVLALEMWRQAFGARDPGLGSALAVLLFLLVIPAMAFNLRRFRRET